MPTPAKPTLLIHASDPLVAALLGALLEEEAGVAFPERGESLEAAVQRTRPVAVIVEAGIEREPERLAPELILFASADTVRRTEANTRCYSLPAEREALHDRVRAVLAAR